MPRLWRPATGSWAAACLAAAAVAACSGSAATPAPAALAPVATLTAVQTLRVQLAGAEAAPGMSMLRVIVRTPPGFEINGLAPTHLTLTSADRAVADPGEAELTWNTAVPESGWPVPVNLAPGHTTLSAAGTIYVCRTGQAEVCLIQPIELVLPLTVTADSRAGAFELRYELPVPPSP